MLMLYHKIQLLLGMIGLIKLVVQKRLVLLESYIILAMELDLNISIMVYKMFIHKMFLLYLNLELE